MRITSKQLRQIIREELNEAFKTAMSVPRGRVKRHLGAITGLAFETVYNDETAQEFDVIATTRKGEPVVTKFFTTPYGDLSARRQEIAEKVAGDVSYAVGADLSPRDVMSAPGFDDGVAGFEQAESEYAAATSYSDSDF
jgi:hypothetical protein